MEKLNSRSNWNFNLRKLLGIKQDITTFR